LRYDLSDLRRASLVSNYITTPVLLPCLVGFFVIVGELRSGIPARRAFSSAPGQQIPSGSCLLLPHDRFLWTLRAHFRFAASAAGCGSSIAADLRRAPAPGHMERGRVDCTSWRPSSVDGIISPFYGNLSKGISMGVARLAIIADQCRKIPRLKLDGSASEAA